MKEPRWLHRVQEMHLVSTCKPLFREGTFSCWMSERLCDRSVADFPAPLRVSTGGQRFGVWNPVAEKSASRAHCSVLRLSEGPQWEDSHYFHGVHAGGESTLLLVSRLKTGSTGTGNWWAKLHILLGQNGEQQSVLMTFLSLVPVTLQFLKTCYITLPLP